MKMAFKMVDTKDGQNMKGTVIGHMVELTEKDLLLLEMILGHEPGGMSDKETINHIDVLYNQVHLMIKDY